MQNHLLKESPQIVFRSVIDNGNVEYIKTRIDSKNY